MGRVRHGSMWTAEMRAGEEREGGCVVVVGNRRYEYDGV